MSELYLKLSEDKFGYKKGTILRFENPEQVRNLRIEGNISEHHILGEYLPNCTEDFIEVGDEQLQTMLKAVKTERYEALQQLSDEKKVMMGDWAQVTEFFIDIFPLYYDRHLRYWSWNKDKYMWEECDIVDIENALIRANPHLEVISLKNSAKGELRTALQRKARLKEPKEVKDTWIQFKKLVIDIQTGERFEATPEYFFKNPIPYDYTENKETPNIDKLISGWVNDEKERTWLYEIAGMCLVPKYFLQTMVFLVGKGSNGKSKYLYLLERLMGEHNYVGSDLEVLQNSNFESYRLDGKLLCVMGEANKKTLSNTGFLKRLTGDDTLRAEAKGKNAYDFVNYAKCLIATNNIPISDDSSDGFYRRMLCITFPNQFGKGKCPVKAITEEEMCSFASKCYDIAKELWHRHGFTNEPSTEEKKQAYENHADPIRRFAEQNIEYDIDSSIPFWELEAQLISYCERFKLPKPTKKDIDYTMKSVFNSTSFRKQKPDGGKIWMYPSVSWSLDTLSTLDSKMKLEQYNKENQFEKAVYDDGAVYSDEKSWNQFKEKLKEQTHFETLSLIGEFSVEYFAKAIEEGLLVDLGKNQCKRGDV